MKDFFIIILCVLLCVLFAFGMAKYSTVQAQSDSIRTISKFIAGHSYIIFINNNDSISVVHDEACSARGNSR